MRIPQSFLCLLLLCLMVAISNPARARAADTEKTTLRWWFFPVFAQEGEEAPGTYERRLADAFERLYPDIRLELTPLNFTTGGEKIQRALQDGDICNILLDAPGRIMDYAKAGHIVPLDGLFTPQMRADIEDERLLQSCSSRGHFYMYPLSSSPFYMAFNKERLEASGVLPLVHEGWTEQDLRKVLQGLRSAGYVPGSLFYRDMGGDQATRAFIANIYSAPFIRDDLSQYTTDTKAFIAGMNFVQEEVERGTILNGDLLNGSDDINRFVRGESSFTLLWGANQQHTYKNILHEYGVTTLEIPFPSNDGKPELEYLVNGFAVFHSKKQHEEEAAQRFVQFACEDPQWSQQSVVRSGCLPVRMSQEKVYSDPAMLKRMEWMQYYATYYNTVDGFAQMRSLWIKMLREILAGKNAPEEAARRFTIYANESLHQQ